MKGEFDALKHSFYKRFFVIHEDLMGKTRDLFKKIRDTKGIFHAKMSSIKDGNGMDLTEAEDIKKRWHRKTVQKRSS